MPFSGEEESIPLLCGMLLALRYSRYVPSAASRDHPLSGNEISKCRSFMWQLFTPTSIKSNINHLTLYIYLGINTHGSHSSQSFA
jgi:hypothetical protein